ncbi:MAG: BON domain-containing protein [Sulfuriferula sp.]
MKLAGISVALIFGLSACDKPGPAETAGKQMDQAANTAGKKIEETASKLNEKMDVEGEKTAVAIDDATITTKVKAAIFAEPGLKTLQISVDTVKGVVTLSGSVNSLTNSDKAKLLAQAVTGVKEVDNRLQVN